MKRKNLLTLSVLGLLTASLVGCTNDGTQGITEDTIYIGNTATTSGGLAIVGVPFNAGLNAALRAYNNAGGFGEEGLKVVLKTYDDKFEAVEGKAMTEKLIEEDQVFALVGHFGTPTVGATLDIIAEKGIPMVYASTGISALYNENAEDGEKAIMPVQPIYDAEGRVLLARALSKEEGNLGLGGKKVGVIYTDDDAGKGMLNGVKLEAADLKLVENTDIVYVETSASATDHATQVNKLKTEGCDVVIVCANQAPFLSIMSYFVSTGYENVDVITSYVSAAATVAGLLTTANVLTETRKVYATAWLDTVSASYKFKADANSSADAQALYAMYNVGGVMDLVGGVPGFSEEYWQFAVDMFGWGVVSQNDLTNGFLYTANSYAMAGYIAGRMFIEGLNRVEESGKKLTWTNYIKAMEESPVKVPMGGNIDYANGQRVGIQDLALNQLSSANDATTNAPGTLVPVSPITSLKDVEAGIAKK